MGMPVHTHSHSSLPLTPGGISAGAPSPVMNPGSLSLPAMTMGSALSPASQFDSSPAATTAFALPRSPHTKRSGTGSSAFSEPEEDETTAKLREICQRIDTDCSGTISELELISAVQRDPEVAECVLPGVDSKLLMSDERCFDEIDAVFNAVAGGKQRIKYADFIAHFTKQATGSPGSADLRRLFEFMDADRSGLVSKLELATAVQGNPEVAEFVMPQHANCHQALGDEELFDAVTGVFETIAGGKKRFDYSDFERHYGHHAHAGPVPHVSINRSSVRIFIIGPGFGLQLNPRQGATIVQAGYQVKWCHDVPNPEQPNFPVQPYLDQIRMQLDEFQPDIVAAASKGGAYVTGLWRVGYWRGPTLLLNAHPTCTQVPEDVQFVLAHGSNDEVYPTKRADLEQLVSTGGANRCLFYHTANSGQLPSGQLSRVGDRHNMESLLSHDLLPRLIDATLCPNGPEVHLVRTWRDRLSEERLEAEQWLGYAPQQLRRHWASHHRKGLDDRKLFDVPYGSKEFQMVDAVFHSAPREPPAYMLSPQATWDRVRILRVQRIENGLQVEGSTKPYHTSLRRSLEEQGVDFEPGLHTSWTFHGADDHAIESIVSNPVAGFQPLASGTRGASLWGLGTYFAREAKYVADGGFCGQPAPDGTRRMLMCLLSTGMPCLGDPQHKGVLPFRRRPHRYHCSVDSLSSPEIYIVQHAGAAQPAYLLTFA